MGSIGGFLSNHIIHVSAVKKTIKAAVAVSNAQTRDRIKLKQLFQQANQRCRTSPYEGVPFTLQDFLAAIDKYDHSQQSRLVLSNRTHTQLGIGSVVTGTVQSLKKYGAFIDIDGINGLLHVSQISHHRVSDIATLLQPGDTLKVMVLSHDRETARLSLSTKILEPTPGDMIRNPNLVFQKAEQTAQTFRQRIAQAEAVARADLLSFQPGSGLTLNSDGMLGPLTSDLAAESVNEIPSAQEAL